jgi:hypothetical protein
VHRESTLTDFQLFKRNSKQIMVENKILGMLSIYIRNGNADANELGYGGEPAGEGGRRRGPALRGEPVPA